jgi:predicted RNA methylase
MSNHKFSDEVKNVLLQSRIEGNNFFLPQMQLTRDLYTQVNKVLINLGGKWDKKEKAHVFQSDPKIKLAEVLDTGLSVDEKKVYQAFYTPTDLVKTLVAGLDLKGKFVLEPSAGIGNIAEVCRDSGALVDCFELNIEAASVLNQKQFFNVFIQDFLLAYPNPKYDYVIMNPPFTKNQDVKHVNHALRWLKSNGVLKAIMANNQTRKPFVKLLQDLDNMNFDYSVQELPIGAFKDAGTSVKTLILTVQT